MWPKCTDLDHRQKAEKVKNAKTSGEKECLEVEYRLRYSSLLQLPYYNAIRMSSIIDPLHNVYLGTTEHIFEGVWLGKGIIPHKVLESVQTRMANIVLYVLRILEEYHQTSHRNLVALQEISGKIGPSSSHQFYFEMYLLETTSSVGNTLS